MKKIFRFSAVPVLVLFVSLASAGALLAPIFTFDKQTHDFGDIFQGDVVETVFTFTNTGDVPISITDIITPCGCTVPEYSKAPIPPQGVGTIKVKFNSTGKSGIQRKDLRILSNASGNDVIRIRANVLPKP